MEHKNNLGKLCCCHHHNTSSVPVEHVEGAMYTCPMHPEVQNDRPGNCPICGMTLEPTHATKENPYLLEYKEMLFKFWSAALLALPLLIINMGGHLANIEWIHDLMDSPYFNWFQMALATPVVFWCGAVFFKRGWDSILSRNLNMFTLIGLGIGVSYGYSIAVTVMPKTLASFFGTGIVLDAYFEPAALITMFALLGQVLELKARAHTSNSLKELLDLTPETAAVIREDKTEEEIAVKDIKIGNLIRILPGGKIPVDGEITNGTSSIDQSMITGESIPVEKGLGDEVIGGTLNGSGSFIMKATKIGKDTMLAKIVDMVSKAQRTKARIQRLADKVSSYFVPTVILLAIITFIAWYNLGDEPRIGRSVFTSIAVLIIACPCALGLATPMSIMVGTGRGAKEGILIKDAENLETLSKINMLILDKTGTITEGELSVKEIVPVDQMSSPEYLLKLAASLEKASEHPLGKAILNAAKERSITLDDYNDFHYTAGKGIVGSVSGVEITVGNKELMKDKGVEAAEIERAMPKEAKDAHSLIYVAAGNKLCGYLIVEDKIKEDSATAINGLKSMGIKIVMLSGDAYETAKTVAEKTGIEEFHAEALPQDKFSYVKAQQDKGYIIAMAGDGINDAPALTQANVGIAMGKGTSIAMESAGIIIISGSLKGITKAIRLSRNTVRNIRQNLFLAFIYNIIALPIAAGVLYPVTGILLSPVIASIAMAFSSVSVIGNALRLSKIK